MERLIYLLSVDEKEFEAVLYDYINIQNANPGEGKDLEHILQNHNIHKNDYIFNVKNNLSSFFKKEL